MWKVCFLVIMFCQVTVSLNISEIFTFLPKFCHQRNTTQILLLSSQLGLTTLDLELWHFMKMMRDENLTVQISGLDEWCYSRTIPEGKRYQIVFIYRASRIDDAFLQQCSRQNQFGSRHNWLIITSTEFAESGFSVLNNISLKLNSYCVLAIVKSHGNIKILDIYKIGKNANLSQNTLGFWNSSFPNKIYWTPLIYKYFQRQNLQGYELQVVTVSVNKFYIETKLTNGKYVVSGGYFGNIFLILQKLLNFTYTLEKLHGYSYGTLNSDGYNWTGIIGVLQRKEADISACEISIVNDRMDAIGFSLTTHQVSLRVYTKFGAKIYIFGYYWQPYSSFAWTGIILFIVIMLLLKRVFRAVTKCCLGIPVKTSLLSDLFSYIAVALQQGSSDPVNMSLRFLQWSTAITFVMINIAYGAKLTSTSTVNQEELPLTSLQDVLDDGWKFTVLKDSLGHRSFQEAPAGSVERNIWTTQLSIKSHRAVSSFLYGLRQVLEKSDYVFLGTEDSCLEVLRDNFTYEEACQIGVLPGKFLAAPLSFGLQKNSPYQKLINFHLLRLIESGINKRLLQKWLPQPRICHFRTHDSAQLSDVLPLFSLLLAGIGVSIFILLVELWVELNINKKRQFKRVKSKIYLQRRVYVGQKTLMHNTSYYLI